MSTYTIEHGASRIIAAHKCSLGGRFIFKSLQQAEDAATVAVTRLYNSGQSSSAKALRAKMQITGDDSRGAVSMGAEIKIKRRKSQAEQSA